MNSVLPYIFIEDVCSKTTDKFAYVIKLKTFHHSLVVFVPFAVLIPENQGMLADLPFPLTYLTVFSSFLAEFGKLEVKFVNVD
jgi:hypothetical protein